MNMLMIFLKFNERKGKFLDVVKARFISKLYILVELFLTCKKIQFTDIVVLGCYKKVKETVMIENLFLLPLKFSIRV